MLVLSRKVSEQVVVPQCELTVTVLDITGSRVRLGFSAPTGLAVLRKEITPERPAEDVQETEDACMSVRILLADRDALLLASCRDCLCLRGATVATATTGLECIQTLRDFAPDVLVLEAELLWGGGDGVLAVIDEQPELRPTLVILVSYASDRGLLHRVSRFKVDDYQRKPFTATRLVHRISKLTGARGTKLDLQTVPA